MSKNVKLRRDPLAGLGPNPNAPSVPATGADADAFLAAPVDQAESRMRKALGLVGEPPRLRPDTERIETQVRLSNRFGAGGLQRRRFVQDGDVPVTVLRREPGHDGTMNRGGPAAAPTSSRPQQVEAALANETVARAQAEQALAETQAGLRDLQTKIGHANLAGNEAQDALRRERDVIAGLRRELEAVRADGETARLRLAEAKRHAADHEDAIAEERQARRSLEKALRAAEGARNEAERCLRTLSDAAPEPAAQVALPHDHAPAPVISMPRKRGRPAIVRQPALPQLEPEPVKWWLTPPKPAIGRR